MDTCQSTNLQNDLQHHEQDEFEVPCDYLVVGAGLAGLSFIDTLLTENQAATVILVDRNSRPGGHWVHAYSFCKLHQPSFIYGVNSIKLGKNRDSKGNEIMDPNDRATVAELLDYFNAVVNQFKECKRVTCYFNAEFGHHQTKAKYNVYTIATNRGETTINVRCKKLVLVNTNVIVPSMRAPLIPIHKTIKFKPLNCLTEEVFNKKPIDQKYQKYVILGAGKTGIDAILYLLNDCNVDKSQLTWIISRDVWFFMRDIMFDESKGYRSLTDLLPPFLQENSVKDAYLNFEKNGIMGRLQPDGDVPEVFKVPFIDRDELELLRTINAIRMGRVQSIEENKMILDHGEVPITSSNTLFVDCMAGDDMYGYGSLAEDYEIFEPGRVNLGPILSIFNPSLSSALVAYMETNIVDEDETKNQLLYFLKGHLSGNREMFLGMLCSEFKTNLALSGKFKSFLKFYVSSRTNPMSPQHHGGSLFRYLWQVFGTPATAKKCSALTVKVKNKEFEDVEHTFGIEERISSSSKKGRNKGMSQGKKIEKTMALRRSIELGQHYPPLPNLKTKIKDKDACKRGCWQICGCASLPQAMTSECCAHL